MIVTPAGEVAAVVDWELCTLGDPLADVGLLMVYRAEPATRSCRSRARPRWRPASRPAPSFVERYAARSRRDVGDPDFFVALAYWKLAAILERARALLGWPGMEDLRRRVPLFGKIVEQLADAPLAPRAASTERSVVAADNVFAIVLAGGEGGSPC